MEESRLSPSLSVELLPSPSLRFSLANNRYAMSSDQAAGKGKANKPQRATTGSRNRADSPPPYRSTDSTSIQDLSVSLSSCLYAAICTADLPFICLYAVPTSQFFLRPLSLRGAAPPWSGEGRDSLSQFSGVPTGSGSMR